MRIFQLILFLISVCSQAGAQIKETYYDFFWQPCDPLNARFFSTVEKTDSGWLRNDYFTYEKKLQMQALYKDEACKIVNGRMIYFHPNGNISLAGRMINGKREGVCVSFHNNGMMADSATFHNDLPVGSRTKWYPNGVLSDSIFHLNEHLDVHMQWFDDGKPAAGGYRKNGKLDGKLKYYHRNGTPSGELIYEEGNLVSCKYFNEDGSELKDTAKANSQAEFKKKGLQGWHDYLDKSLYWPTDYQLSEAATVTVGVEFTVDENGNIIEPHVYLPFHPAFDRIALLVVKNSPAWKPTVQHNRKIKAIRRQPISFSQPE